MTLDSPAEAENSQLLQTGVAVEKLTHQKMAKKNFALGSPTNDFLDFPRHFLPPNFGCFGENGVFQQPQAITLKCPAQGHDECNGDVSTVIDSDAVHLQLKR